MYTTIILFVGFTVAYSIIWHFQSSNAASESRPSQKVTERVSGSDAAPSGKVGTDRNADLERAR